MTLFLDVNALRDLVNKTGTSQFISGLLHFIEQDFIRWPYFDKSPRTAAHSKAGVIELMPVADDVNYGFKYVNGHPKNPTLGLSTVMAFGALSDVDSGYPKLLSEMTLSTAFRTAVTSAMAAKALAKPNARNMGIVGCGSQCEFQVIAFHIINNINEVRIFDIDEEAMDKVEKNLKHYHNIKIIRGYSVKDCVQGADIVTTVTAMQQF